MITNTCMSDCSYTLTKVIISDQHVSSLFPLSTMSCPVSYEMTGDSCAQGNRGLSFHKNRLVLHGNTKLRTVQSFLICNVSTRPKIYKQASCRPSHSLSQGQRRSSSAHLHCQVVLKGVTSIKNCFRIEPIFCVAQFGGMDIAMLK